MRNAYGIYRSLAKYVEWADTAAQKKGEARDARIDEDFRSGVYLGNGLISMILGLLPGKVLKIMEVRYSLFLLFEGWALISCCSHLCALFHSRRSLGTLATRSMLCAFSRAPADGAQTPMWWSLRWNRAKRVHVVRL